MLHRDLTTILLIGARCTGRDVGESYSGVAGRHVIRDMFLIACPLTCTAPAIVLLTDQLVAYYK